MSPRRSLYHSKSKDKECDACIIRKHGTKLNSLPPRAQKYEKGSGAAEATLKAKLHATAMASTT